MARASNWWEYLRQLSVQGLDSAVYASRWARDVRCIRPGVEHRRVGVLGANRSHSDWFELGIVSNQYLPIAPDDFLHK